MTSSQPQTVLIIVGPTGVGKTDVAYHLAGKLDGEIVSADSRLVYRMMDIGTAKPSLRMRGEVPHHMIDVTDPDRQYTCKQFETQARDVIQEIAERGRVPIVVGGSGLYVRALTEGIFDGPAGDTEIRTRLEKEARIKGKIHLWQRLMKVDPEKASQTDPENLVRIIRALEVFEITGRPMSQLEKGAMPIARPVSKIGLDRDRQELYQITERRVDRMMEMGLVEEVRDLVRLGYGTSSIVRDCLGYKEILLYLDGSISIEDAIDLIKKNTRHFAKRQLTWFRNESDVTWIDITGRQDYDQIAAEIVSSLHSSQ